MIPVKILAQRQLANVSDSLAKALGAPEGFHSLGFLTTDSDDPTYIALDAATKAAEVEVAYGHSFYAGAANASTPNAGEVIGILAGRTPGAVRSGMDPVEALKAITINPAKHLGIDGRVGSIEVGKLADFVVCDEDLQRKAVYLGGEAL